MHVNISYLLSIHTLIVVTFLIGGLYFNIYYLYIYLNRIEREYGIKSLGYDSYFSRMRRVQILMTLASVMKWKFLGEKTFKEVYQTDWYGQQYMQKVPYEAIRPYLHAIFLVFFVMILPFVYNFIHDMGWNFSFYWK